MQGALRAKRPFGSRHCAASEPTEVVSWALSVMRLGERRDYVVWLGVRSSVFENQMAVLYAHIGRAYSAGSLAESVQ